MGLFDKISSEEVVDDRIPTSDELEKASSRKWSDQQEEIFSWFRTGHGNLVVRARAGTGKTTTILEGTRHAPEARILLAAFNKRIADELAVKIQGTGSRAEAKTLHGVGFGCIRNYWNKITVDADRGERLARLAYGDDNMDLRSRMPFELMRLVRDIADKGKEIHPLDATEENLEDLAVAFDLVPDDALAIEYPLRTIVGYALKAMRLSSTTNDGTITFSDMLFLPLVNGWAHGKYDLVIVDECQDMNPAQILLAQRVLKKGGRLVAVGDDRQAIYGFRGADSGSLDRIKREYEAAELGLTITYRCPKAVVQEAAELVSDYKAADSAPDGVVRSSTVEKMLVEAGPGDFVLSRKNAPLASLALRWMREGRRVKIEGKDIGKGLLSLVRKMKSRTIPDLFKKLGTWSKREIERAASLSKRSAIETRVQYVTDQAGTIESLSEGVSSVRELEQRIEGLFSDDGHGNNIVCSTVHKAKGLEADRVWLLDDTFTLNSDEEDNIRYVAITRAKKELIYVTGETE